MKHALGRDEVVLRGRTGAWSWRVHRRTAITVCALGGVAVCLLVASLLTGDYRVTPDGLVDTLLGSPPDRMTEFFVVERRLPRALVAMTVGAALALGGAIFQMLTRNPLASPDVLGVSHGASAGAVLVLLVFGGTLTQASVGAAVGAAVTAVILVVLTARTGLRGMGLILTGVGLAAIAAALIDYVLSQVFIASAVTAQTWIVGSLHGRGWEHLAPVAAALAVTLPILALTASGARLSELGDDAATALGSRTEPLRRVLIGTATLLVAVAVATAGPVSFVALVAPHLARMITGRAGLVAAAGVGAVLLAAADLIAQYAFGAPVPVGAITVSLGGVFFLWLLVREGRARG